MPNAGPNSAGTGADDASVGTLSWTNPSNITAADGSVSSATNNSTALPSDTTVKLVVGGSVTGNNNSAGASWSQTLGYVSFGSSSDTWGLSPTAAQINGSDFGLVL